jgi:hypothetical protein
MPIVTPPSRNVTVPVGVTLAPEAVATVAVNVTDAPKVTDADDELTVVVVEAWLTVTEVEALFEIRKFVSPP